MKAYVLKQQKPVREKPLKIVDTPPPKPGPDELLIKVKACAMCRTDLHVIEGDLKAHKMPVIPGHQVVGTVAECGDKVTEFKKGDAAGIAWLRHTCGKCAFCTSDRENLCPDSRHTGWDVDGGYAEYATVPAAFAYHMPETIEPATVAPLLCAGIIGYRALKRSQLQPGGHLGIYGFGSSAHIVLQIARHWKCEVSVVTRGKKHRELAESMDATWVGSSQEKPPKKFTSAIIFAPAGELVPIALESLEKGGTVSLAGIHMSDVPPLNYNKHLFYERTIRSVTSNTREDGKELMKLAQEIPLKPKVQAYDFKEANGALIELKEDRIQGSGVLLW